MEYLAPLLLPERSSFSKTLPEDFASVGRIVCNKTCPTSSGLAAGYLFKNESDAVFRKVEFSALMKSMIKDLVSQSLLAEMGLGSAAELPITQPLIARDAVFSNSTRVAVVPSFVFCFEILKKASSLSMDSSVMIFCRISIALIRIGSDFFSELVHFLKCIVICHSNFGLCIFNVVKCQKFSVSAKNSTCVVNFAVEGKFCHVARIE